MKELFKELKKLVGKENFKTNVNIKNYLTFHIDTIAKILIEVYNKDSLIKLLEFLHLKNIKFICLGGGSNILFKTKYIKYIVIHFCDRQCRFFYQNGKHYLSAFAGCKVSNIIKSCRQKGFSCLEWAVGIPASIGGATIMNLSSGNKQLKDVVKSVTYFKDGKIKKTYKNDLFFYRNSWYKEQNCVIINVTLILKKEQIQNLQNDILFYLSKKSISQPLNAYSCGSTFKNGENYKVAKLIEDSNLKGKQIGGAMVSNKHSNFIINQNNATSKDIIKLINFVKKEIYKKYKIRLKEEIIIK